ncbi:MAG: ATP-binding cassette domain-containing protein, partial [Alphaproteobacteria bacterium]
ARAGDALGNVMLVQSFVRLQVEARQLGEVMQQVLAAQYPVLTMWAVVSVLSRASATIVVIGIFVMGTWLHMQGLATVGEIVTFMGLATQLIGRMEGAMGFLSSLIFQVPALQEYFSVLDHQSTIREAPGAVDAGRVKGEVAFEHVTLSYDGERPAVNDLSFHAPAGTVVALVGHTGSGKSTSMALLHRVWDPQSGTVRIDGTDIREFTLDSLRHNIGVVFQDTTMFYRTIAENLRIAKPDATDAELERAARLAEAHDFIMAQPQGYDTLVGERGITLSGGERQRLAIARAILKDPPILILDEATSALDATTEARIQHALNDLMKGRTTFIIAHRLSTVRNADLILVLDRGRIVERGSFAELVEARGAFAALVATQLGMGRDTPGPEAAAEAARA